MQNTQGNFSKTPKHINNKIIVDFNEGLNQCPWWKPAIAAGDDVVHIRVPFGRAEDKHLVWFDTNRTKQLHS